MDLKELSTLVDSYYKAREERLRQSSILDDLTKRETSLKMKVISALVEGGAGSGGGSLCTVTLHEKVKPHATNWSMVEEYVYENKAFDLFQRRLTEKAVKLRMEDGIEIPGIDMYTVYDLTISNKR